MAASHLWREAYALGIPAVDAEHRRFFELLGVLDAEARAGGDPARLRLHLAQLAAYARTHFHNEEQFLEAVGCPEVELQRREHAACAEHLRGLALVEDPGCAHALRFARDWMVEHILGTDRCYTRWLGAALEPAEQAMAFRGYGVIRL